MHNGVFLPQPRWSMGDTGPIHQPMVNVYVPQSATLVGVDVPPTCSSTQPVDRTLREVCRRDTPDPASWSGDRPPEHAELGKKVWPVTIDIRRMEGSVGFDYDGRRRRRQTDGAQQAVVHTDTRRRDDRPSYLRRRTGVRAKGSSGKDGHSVGKAPWRGSEPGGVWRSEGRGAAAGRGTRGRRGPKTLCPGRQGTVSELHPPRSRARGVDDLCS